MELKEGKEKFLQAWGTLGSNWGINRTMAQIHALLLIAPEALSSEEIRQELNISMGNANMNVRALIDWGLVYKELKPGERKEYFVAEKDMWEVTRKVITERKKKELEPLVKILDDINIVDGDSKEVEEFKKVVQEMQIFARKADSTLDNLVKTKQSWLVNTFMGMMK
ncbi:MAG: DNA-binding transcriptional regulator GbsR (MarR family) [Saprospiraceae bacterium]|jgi:DNA-binding transcriptional regulator GbsR (MarR family)|tara:strand:- start:631 stop:1131 length:501 start_codon:yes stop_codon:yes gene_type:complete